MPVLFNIRSEDCLSQSKRVDDPFWSWPISRFSSPCFFPLYFSQCTPRPTPTQMNNDYTSFRQSLVNRTGSSGLYWSKTPIYCTLRKGRGPFSFLLHINIDSGTRWGGGVSRGPNHRWELFVTSTWGHKGEIWIYDKEDHWGFSAGWLVQFVLPSFFCWNKALWLNKGFTKRKKQRFCSISYQSKRQND